MEEQNQNTQFDPRDFNKDGKVSVKEQIIYAADKANEAIYEAADSIKEGIGEVAEGVGKVFGKGEKKD